MSAVRYAELSPEEARGLLDWYVSTYHERARAFIAAADRQGGPARDLDFTRQSLRPLGTWLVQTQHRSPESEEAMQRNDPPWWFRFHPPLASELGTNLARLVTGVSAYVAATFMHERPRSTWGLGMYPENVDYNEVVLRVAGGREVNFDGAVLAEAIKTFRMPKADRNPEFLIRLYDWFDQPYLDNSKSDAGAAPYYIGSFDDPEFTHEIGIDHVLAREQDDRLERLMDLLRASRGISRVAREDRELILVSAPEMSPKSIERLVRSAWRRSAEDQADGTRER